MAMARLADAGTPLKLTVPPDPNPEPVIVTMSPIAPVISESATIVGMGVVTVKLPALLGMPLTVTWRVPLRAR